ncbi:tRNA pseudouridine synthase 3 [Blyttiomyces sp. JEL0837]|nr:tRNA pseudouridine synthase 3 [Blyttiomyces sp. JEL0837]
MSSSTRTDHDGDGSTSSNNYDSWSKDDLIAKIKEMEKNKKGMHHDGPEQKKEPVPHQQVKQQNETDADTTNTAASSSAQPSGSSTKGPNDNKAANNSGKNQNNKNNDNKGKKKDKQQQRPFDFTKHAARPVALKVAYLGWKYYGLASQEEETVETIEGHLFEVLTRARLIPSRKECNWSRCGRTDKGVSSFGQVVGLHIRTALPIGAPGTTLWPFQKTPEEREKCIKRKRTHSDDDDDDDEEGADGTDDGLESDPRVGVDGNGDVVMADASDTNSSVPIPPGFKEISYITILNRLLPPDIRVLAWSPTPLDFQARFDCSFRRYKYFFPSEGLDLAAMKEAAAKYVGKKDFRYFCKVDPTKHVTTYERKVLMADVRELRWVNEDDEDASDGQISGRRTDNGRDKSSDDAASALLQLNPSPVSGLTSNLMPLSLKRDSGPSSFFVFEVKGHAFLWHQVRCMMAILHLVGRGLEEPSIIDYLTDPSLHPPGAGRPIYNMANEIPLVLVECGFPSGMLQWRFEEPGDADLKRGNIDTIIPDSFEQLITSLWTQWRHHAIRAVQLRSLLDVVGPSIGADGLFELAADGILAEVAGESGGFGGKGTMMAKKAAADSGKLKKYISLKNRPRCESIEERTRKHEEAKKKKREAKAMADSPAGSPRVEGGASEEKHAHKKLKGDQ